MTKNDRYETIRILIKTGNITEFRQVFSHVRKTAIARDIHANNNRITRLISNAEDFTAKELFIISDLWGVDRNIILDLVYNQYSKKEKAGKK